jgi:hypothetical protein
MESESIWTDVAVSENDVAVLWYSQHSAVKARTHAPLEEREREISYLHSSSSLFHLSLFFRHNSTHWHTNARTYINNITKSIEDDAVLSNLACSLNFIVSQNPKPLISSSISRHEGPPFTVLPWRHLRSSSSPSTLRHYLRQLPRSGFRQISRKPRTRRTYYSSNSLIGKFALRFCLRRRHFRGLVSSSSWASFTSGECIFFLIIE